MLRALGTVGDNPPARFGQLLARSEPLIAEQRALAIRKLNRAK